VTDTLRIGEKEYSLDSIGSFLVPLCDLGNFTIGMIPAHSTIEISGLPSCQEYELSIRVTNGGDDGSTEYLTIFSYLGCTDGPEVDDRMSRLRRAMMPFLDRGELPDPLSFPIKMDGRLAKGAGFNIDCEGQPGIVIADAVQPLLRLFHALIGTMGPVFICHASEDRPVAVRLAAFLQSRGIAAWLDRWEIAVGDSIVEKINLGLQTASHLAILLSFNSISRPWVTKELSSALMRHLADRSIGVLPIRLDDAQVPAILADIRYADCRYDADRGFSEVVEAVRNAMRQ
jgi:hypothetical protein